MPQPTLSASRLRRLIALGGAAVAVGAVSLCASGAALAVLPALEQTVMTSVTPASPPVAGDHASGESSVSSNGRFVAFSSLSDDLVSVGNHEKSQVYKRDQLTGVTTLVSAAMAGTDSANADATDPSISADGRFVSFTSSAHNLALPLDLADDHKQVFIRDTVTGMTRKISLTPRQLSGGNGDSEWSSISADGSRVAFQSAATNILPGLATTDTQVYIAQNATDPAIQLGSARQGVGITLPNDDSTHPSLSGDGQSVAFVSAASDITAKAGNGQTQIYLRSLSASTTSLLSYTARDRNEFGLGPSDHPSVSFDGSRVAYDSKALDLVTAGVNRSRQVYLNDRITEKNILVTFNSANTLSAAGDSSVPSISGKGDVVAFTSMSQDLTTVPTFAKTQAYIRSVDTSTTRMVSVQRANPAAGGTADSNQAAVSGDGNYVGFTSLAPGLAETAASLDTQTYLRAMGAVAPPTTTPATPVPTPTVAPTGSPSATGVPPTGGSAGGGERGAGGSRGGLGSGGTQLASTGMSQAPIILAGVAAAALALVGGSILFGSRAARRKKQAAHPADSE
ncbi:hypothetical protein B7R22_01505 [Subtercola boreus]|uniref:Gram-positive cocci surface proteins LPxTG domain-containing protein n=1 Tax=Subtercola boreus TaxID=120213 RepID=A0A3E0W3R2_9MICO|nr:PD40 domain-containing protein [Subtercola boreus]RFA17004.1 hypothetical protein B7R22_01505 [Subtercola boreus]